MFPGVRFVVGACGTKFGKTYGCSLRAVKEAWENQGHLVWWVAPTYAQAKNAFEFIVALLPSKRESGVQLFREHKQDLFIEILNPDGSTRSKIEFKSGDRPGNLRGFGVHFFVIDEAVYFDYQSFVSVVTTVTQTGGRGIIISTPQGRTWFYDVYQRGVKVLNGKPKYRPHLDSCNGEEGCDCPDVDPWAEWMSIRLPTWSNPHVPVKNVKQAKKNLPPEVFRQEFAAEFISENTGVFRNILGCVRNIRLDDPGFIEAPIPGHRYVIGVDLAKLKDYTVIIVMDITGGRNQVVKFDRFKGQPWDVTKLRVMQACRDYNFATACVDETGLGQPVVEDIQNGGVSISPYKISGNAQKVNLVEKLRIGIEQTRFFYPEIGVLIQELEDYEYEFTGSVVKYNAPPGKHDDCVIALALCWWIADSPPFIYRHMQVRM